MKIFYPVKGIDGKFQNDHINPSKIQLFEQYRGFSHNAHRIAKLFAMVFKHRGLKVTSDGKKLTQVTVIRNGNTLFKSLSEEI